MLLPHLLKFCAASCFAFATLLGLIHSQPPDDADLRAFVTFPERCETACFLGIRPGFTQIDRAIRSLERSALVVEVNNGVSQVSGTGEVSWRWSDSAPAVLNTAYPGRLRAGSGIVSMIIVEMRTPAGMVQLALQAAPFHLEGARWNVDISAACPGYMNQFWFTPARLELSLRGAQVSPLARDVRFACAP